MFPRCPRAVPPAIVGAIVRGMPLAILAAPAGSRPDAVKMGGDGLLNKQSGNSDEDHKQQLDLRILRATMG
ncbi:hypothetical protein [Burkholderia vietnamiensis]|uniref:hypothetical protein n=1 Tax=Burkholderia vietnamiensis TaxID=60552 RepID=UPI001CB3EC4B|nr:hypothetical protein [Burkholderia vietnamiensis]CAG9233558.1 hypothetical protein BVI434_870034 [Burkholderia vietnamiensis]